MKLVIYAKPENALREVMMKGPKVLLLLSRPFNLLDKKIQARTDVYAVDTVGTLHSNRVAHVPPQSLTGMSLAINQMILLAKEQGEPTVIIDSITMLQAYHSSESILRFINFLLSRLETVNTECVITLPKSAEHTDIFNALNSRASSRSRV